MLIAGILGSLFTGPVLKTLAGSILDRAAPIIQAYATKQISRDEALAKLSATLVECVRDIQVAHAEALTKTFDSFQQTVRSTPEIARMVKTVVYSQTFVLVWNQFVIPTAYWLGYRGEWKPGTSAEWAYLLIGGLCGMAPMLLQSGPGAGNLVERMKGLVK